MCHPVHCLDWPAAWRKLLSVPVSLFGVLSSTIIVWSRSSFYGCILAAATIDMMQERHQWLCSFIWRCSFEGVTILSRWMSFIAFRQHNLLFCTSPLAIIRYSNVKVCVPYYSLSNIICRDFSNPVKAKFHYAIWSQTGPKLVADLQRAGIWPII